MMLCFCDSLTSSFSAFPSNVDDAKYRSTFQIFFSFFGSSTITLENYTYFCYANFSDVFFCSHHSHEWRFIFESVGVSHNGRQTSWKRTNGMNYSLNNNHVSARVTEIDVRETLKSIARSRTDVPTVINGAHVLFHDVPAYGIILVECLKGGPNANLLFGKKKNFTWQIFGNENTLQMRVVLIWNPKLMFSRLHGHGLRCCVSMAMVRLRRVQAI